VESALARLRSADHPRIVLFGCAADEVEAVADAHTAAVPLVCAGQLPPALVEYALRAGADGVMVTGCREGDCEFRLGNRWTDARIAGVREPRLRASVSPQRVRLAWIGRGRLRALRCELREFRQSLTEDPTNERIGR
jgi:coenzyme F420-reducing hydrogenase delta subunit